jgi:hypothetical protein
MNDSMMQQLERVCVGVICELFTFDEMYSVKKRLKSWVVPDFVKCRLEIDFGQWNIPPRVRLVERSKG